MAVECLSEDGMSQSRAGGGAAFPNGAVVDAKATPAASTCENIWLYGYDPKLKTCSATPNGLPLMKVLASGEVRWLFFELTSLLAALRLEGKAESLTLEDLKEAVSSLTEDKVRSLKKSGTTIKYAEQRPWETAYVPAGWYVAEESLRGVLVYGVRRTLVVKTPASHEQYEALTGVYSASGNAAHVHMSAALRLME